MLLALEEINSDPLAFGVFEKYLDKQKKTLQSPEKEKQLKKWSLIFQP
jgi:hypothetical protein